MNSAVVKSKQTHRAPNFLSFCLQAFRYGGTQDNRPRGVNFYFESKQSFMWFGEKHTTFSETYPEKVNALYKSIEISSPEGGDEKWPLIVRAIIVLGNIQSYYRLLLHRGWKRWTCLVSTRAPSKKSWKFWKNIWRCRYVQPAFMCAFIEDALVF